MLHLTVASAALKNRGKSIEKPLDLNEKRSSSAEFQTWGKLDSVKWQSRSVADFAVRKLCLRAVGCLLVNRLNLQLELKRPSYPAAETLADSL